MFWYGLKLDLRVTDNKTDHTHVIKNKTFIFFFNLKEKEMNRTRDVLSIRPPQDETDVAVVHLKNLTKEYFQ